MTTYAKAKNFIKETASADGFYDTIRAILSSDMENYPEDHQIKELQALADHKYKELIGE